MTAIDSQQDRQKNWQHALSIYLNPRVLGMLFLGFAAGLPFAIVLTTLPARLSHAGVDIATVGFFAWLGFAYSFKIFWAPIVDRLPLPILSRLLGRRRSWMLLAQAAIISGLVGLAITRPEVTDGLVDINSLWLIAIFAGVVAIGSATQDIVIDAYRIEAVSSSIQGAMAAMYIGGYRAGSLMAVAGAFYLAEFISWEFAFFALVAAMFIGVITVLVTREPVIEIDSETTAREQAVIDSLQHKNLPSVFKPVIAWFINAVIEPFIDFFKRYTHYALIILIFISLYRISDIVVGVLATPFYLKVGFTLAEIASVAKIFGFFMTLLGAALGGVLILRFGILRILLLGAVLVVITNLLLAVLFYVGKDIVLLAAVIASDNLSAGIATAAFIAYLSSLTNQAYTATQYALFSSLMTLFPKLIAGFSGVIVELSSFGLFFIYAAILGVPVIFLCVFLMKHDRKLPTG